MNKAATYYIPTAPTSFEVGGIPEFPQSHHLLDCLGRLMLVNIKIYLQ